MGMPVSAGMDDVGDHRCRHQDNNHRRSTGVSMRDRHQSARLCSLMPVHSLIIGPIFATFGAHMSLSSLGLTALDEDVYHALLRGVEPTAGDQDMARSALKRLVAL